ncbi:hypothetical protein [Pseudomonas purpurea]|uniref:hypothetical protein n=1 Tax=Pseudomonas purpurea TaxID=3136737 RepID=UPI003264E3FA
MFNLAWPRLHEALELDEYVTGLQARKRSREKARSALFSIALPFLTAFTALFYVNLPGALRIVHGSSFDLWDFDVTQTLYVMLTCTLILFAVHFGWLTARLAAKWRKLA